MIKKYTVSIDEMIDSVKESVVDGDFNIKTANVFYDKDPSVSGFGFIATVLRLPWRIWFECRLWYHFGDGRQAVLLPTFGERWVLVDSDSNFVEDSTGQVVNAETIGRRLVDEVPELAAICEVPVSTIRKKRLSWREIYGHL